MDEITISQHQNIHTMFSSHTLIHNWIRFSTYYIYIHIFVRIPHLKDKDNSTAQRHFPYGEQPVFPTLNGTCLAKLKSGVKMQCVTVATMRLYAYLVLHAYHVLLQRAFCHI